MPALPPADNGRINPTLICPVPTTEGCCGGPLGCTGEPKSPKLMPVQAAPKPAKPSSRPKRQIRRETGGGGIKPRTKPNMNKLLSNKASAPSRVPNGYI